MNTTQSNNNKHASTRRVAGKRSSANRSVLVCDLSATHTDLSEAIESAGWRVDTANSSATAEKHLYAHDYHVGVAFITAHEQLKDLDELLTRHHIHWVAVVAAPLVGEEPVAALISDHCYDYHTLPCDQNNLIATLGHAYGMSCLLYTSPSPRDS